MADTPKSRVLAKFPKALCRRTDNGVMGVEFAVYLAPHDRCPVRSSAVAAWKAAAEALEPEPADVAETRLDSIRADAAANPDRVFIVGDEPRDLTPLESLANIKADIASVTEAPAIPEAVRLRDVDVKVSGATLETPRIAVVGPGDGCFAERLDLARMADEQVRGVPIVLSGEMQFSPVADPFAELDEPFLNIQVRDPGFTKGKPFPKHRDQQRPPRNMAQHAKAKREMQRASRRANRGR